MRQRMTSVWRRTVLLVGVLITLAAPLFVFTPTVSALQVCAQGWVKIGFVYDGTPGNDRCEKAEPPGFDCAQHKVGDVPAKKDEAASGRGITVCYAAAFPDKKSIQDKQCSVAGYVYDQTQDRCEKQVGDKDECAGNPYDTIAGARGGAQYICHIAVTDQYTVPEGVHCPGGYIYTTTYKKCVKMVKANEKCDDGSAPQDDRGAKVCFLPTVATGTCANKQFTYNDKTYLCEYTFRGPGECPAGSLKSGEENNQITCVADATIAANPDGSCPGNSVPAAAVEGKKQCKSTAAESARNIGDWCPIEVAESVRWATCPVFWVTSALTKTLDYFMNEYMTVGNAIFKPGENGYKKAWTVFRNLSIGLVVIAGLVMLASEAFGMPIVDAYTVRKVLPRLLMAIFGIATSWEFCQILVNLFDDLGHAVGSTIYTAFDIGGEVNIAATIISNLVLGGVATTTALVLTSGGILSLFGTLVMAMLIGAAVLIIRQTIIVAVVIFSPLAIAAYVLPNTAKLGSFVWDTLWRMLALYPFAIGIISLCKALGLIAMQNPGGPDGNSSIGNLLAVITGSFIFIAGYLLLPLAFRLTGGMVATLGGMANDKSRGFFDKQKKYRAETMAKSKHDMATGNRWKGDSKPAAWANNKTRNIAGLRHGGLTVSRKKFRQRMQAGLSRNSMQEAAEYGEKNAEFAVIKNNDDYLNAGLAGKMTDDDARNYLQGVNTRAGKEIYSGAAIEQGVAAIRAARRAAPREVFETAAAMALPATGTAFAPEKDANGKVIAGTGGAGEMGELINKVAGADRVKATSMLAAMRSGAAGARRFDIAGGGFGGHAGVLEEQYQHSLDSTQGKDRTEATKEILKQSLEGQGGSYIAGARTKAVESLAPAMRDKLQEVYDSSGNSEDFQRELATIAGRYDAMASVSPDNARILAKEVLTYNVNGNGQTVQQLIENSRSDPAFVSMRREYGGRDPRSKGQGGEPPIDPATGGGYGLAS